MSMLKLLIILSLAAGITSKRFNITVPVFNEDGSDNVQASCPGYDFCVAEDPPLSLFWGFLADDCPGQYPSGIKLTVDHLRREATTDSAIVLGQLQSRNMVIDSNPGAPDEIKIAMDIVIEQNEETILVPLEIDLFIDETLNQAPCAYPSDRPCADRHIYSFIPPVPTFMLGGEMYEITVFPENNFVLIIQEACNSDNQSPPTTTTSTQSDPEPEPDADSDGVPDDEEDDPLFPSEPVNFSVVISCLTCCPLRIWVDQVARMYLPWAIHFRADSDILPITGDIVIRNQNSTFVKIIKRDHIIEEEESTFVWRPNRMYPGFYLVTFDGACNSDSFQLNIR